LPWGTEPLGPERRTPDRENAKENRKWRENEAAKPICIKHVSSPQQRGQSQANHCQTSKSRDDTG
jgi:hypothetical protein